VRPEAIRARLDALREAGARLRARPDSSTRAALARVLDTWSDPRSAWRRELEARLPEATGFAPATVRKGLSVGLAAWNGAALERLLLRELGPAPAPVGARQAFGFETTAVVLAGAIPMPSLLAIVAPLALGSPVLAKPASRDRVSAELVAGSLAEVDAELGACVALAPVAGSDADAMAALLEAECVVAYGDDATVASLAARTAPPRRFVAHGHRLSLAVLGPEATRGAGLRAAASSLALDVALWDQLGCLSPIAVHVVDEDAAASERVARALAEALAEASRRWPRGSVESAAAARFASARDEALLREASGAGVRVHADPDGAWCVVQEGDAQPRGAPLHRFVRVHPAADAAALGAALTPLRRRLAGVALAGFGAREPDVARALAALGASRVCPPGALQAPPLDWPNGGLGVLTPLARLASVEAGAPGVAAAAE
jgi:hypothetical protein